MSVRIECDRNPDKALDLWFAEVLPLVGVQTKKDIFTAGWEVRWPMPPDPVKDYGGLRWRTYRSVVKWPDDLLSALLAYGGVAKAQEAVLACRVETEVARLHCLLNEVVAEIPRSDEVVRRARAIAEEREREAESG